MAAPRGKACCEFGVAKAPGFALNGGMTRAVLLACLALSLPMLLPAAARADEGLGEPPAMRGPRKGVIEVVPQLGHHYRDGFADPAWSRYGEQGFGYGAPPPGAEGEDNSLDRQPPRGACDPWRGGCRPAQPWWTRERPY